MECRVIQYTYIRIRHIIFTHRTLTHTHTHTTHTKHKLYSAPHRPDV